MRGAVRLTDLGAHDDSHAGFVQLPKRVAAEARAPAGTGVDGADERELPAAADLGDEPSHADGGFGARRAGPCSGFSFLHRHGVHAAAR